MNIVKTIKQTFKFNQIRYFVQQKDPRINADHKNSKETLIPVICQNPANCNGQCTKCKVTTQGEDVNAKENVRINVQLKNCREINGVIAYI